MIYSKETKRINATPSFSEIVFEKPNTDYLIKNFSENDAYVSFSSTATESDSIKIASGMYQICNKTIWVAQPWEHSDSHAFETIRTDKIYIKGSGEIEISQV